MHSFRNILFSIIAVFFVVSPATGQQIERKYQILFDEFDAGPLTINEKRFLQTALAFQDYYNGLLDGRWGSGSQSAIEEYAQEKFQENPRNIAIATLVIDFLANVEERGWQLRFLPELGVSLALPMKGSGEPFANNGSMNWEHPASSLSITTARQYRLNMEEAHRKGLLNRALGAEVYSLRRDANWITSVEQNNGLVWYIRSFKIGGAWSTISVTSNLNDRHLLNTVVASMVVGREYSWDLPEGGFVSRIVYLADEFIKQKEQDAPKPESQVSSFGSGFYINRAAWVLTNAHVVEQCRTVSANSQEMDLHWANDELDVAILKPKSDRAIHTTVSFALNPVHLNTDVTVAGFPLPGILEGLNMTRGSVSGLKGLEGDVSKFQISAAIQQGNSGGPVFDQTGTVIGMVVEKLDAGIIAEATGDIPQNVNFAIRSKIIEAILAANDIPFYYADQPSLKTPTELADFASAVTVFIKCR